METKAFKDIKLSRLGMGNMRLPYNNGNDKDIDYVKSQEIIDYGMANGITYYDTAYVYHGGESEKFLGEAFKKYDRDSHFIATKFNYMANPDYKAVFEEQLERMQIDCIDFYLLHAIGDGNYEDYINCGCIEYFEEQMKAGRIKYLGFSAHASVEVLEKFASLRDWDFAQIQLNYFDWLYGSTQEEYKILESKNIPIVVMEPIRGGRLADLIPEANEMLKAAHPEWSIASWALRFVRSLPQVQVILSGMSTLDQIVDNVATFKDETPFTEEDKEILFKACEIFHSELQVPCTACRYCTPECPMEINIPGVLKVYNAYKVGGPWHLQRMKDVDSKGMPADCIECGACMKHCPQGIKIPEIMAELKEALAK